MKRRKVEAWAVVDRAGVVWTHTAGLKIETGERIVHLVEHEPAEARELKRLRAVAKAAVAALEQLQKPKHPHSRAESAIAILSGPIAALQKARGKRR